MYRQVRVSVTGRVQGVWYRGWTVATASDMGLRGWVRNRRDGSVEAVFGGDHDAVQDMLSAMQEGPPAARVDGVRTKPDESLLPNGFEQRPSA